VQNRNAQLNSQFQEAHIKLSVRESNIAGAGNQVLELRQQLEADRAQLREREFNLGVFTAQLQEREARHNALQTARDAETAGRDEASATRHVANDGVTTLPHQTDILMAGGVPSSAARHSSAAYRPPHGNVGRPHFHPSTPLPSRTSPLDARLPVEEDRSFCAFDVTTWPSRIWNEGASGVIIDLRCAYQCWKQGNEQVKLAFGILVELIGVLEGLQDPTDQLIDFGSSLLNTFRMQLTMASDPGIRLSKLRARLHTAVHQTDTYARAARPLVDRRETQRTVRCQRCHIFGHEASTCNVRPRGNYSQYRRSSKNGRGDAARRSWMLATAAPSIPPPTNPHRQRTAPPTLHPIFQIARRNCREGRWSLSVNGARLWYDELPTVPLWASYMRKANEVAREMWAPSTWERGMSLAGQFTTFCRTHEQPTNAESCAV
ncbi:structural maintenance of chromosome protein 4, partial [Trypanosoma cruzi]